MQSCPETYPRSRRHCGRPALHEGSHGDMLTIHNRFSPSRRLAEYAGQGGSEPGGQRLSPAAYDALGASKTTGNPPELVVVGEFRREDGAIFLDYGVTTEYIEANSGHRLHRDTTGPDGVSRQGTWTLRRFCRECEFWDGRHAKSCKA